MSCGDCRWLHTYGTVTLYGKVVREGTICELDAYCWDKRIAWVDLPDPPQQPERAKPAYYSEADASGKLE